jgi:hypothetical protein
MKRFAILLAFLLAAPALAQTATLATPETPSANLTYLLVGSVTEQRADPNDPNTGNRISIVLWKMTAAGVRAPDASSLRVDLTANADISGFLAAVETPFAGEVAGTTLAARARRHNGRVLNYLVTGCPTFTPSCAAQISAATMVP